MMVENGYAEELATEQAHFDKARVGYDSSLAYDSPSKWNVGTGPERRAMKKHVDSKERLADGEPVAFGRMDLEDGDRYYVGKVAISDEGRDKLVISWKSPMAKKYYQATTADQLGLLRKRDFRTTRNHVDSFSDKVFKQIAAAIESLDDEIRADDALLHSLATSRTGKMQDIVRTIQASQDRLMRRPKDQLLVVQGGPGTGKTAVALHRASWLLYTYSDELPADDMLVVGPNPAFTKYIQQVLPALGDQRVRQTSIHELLAGELRVRATEPANVARVKGLADMADVIARGLDDRIKVPTSPLRINRRNSAATVTIQRETVAPDIKELRSEPYGRGREELKARLLTHCAAAAGLRSGIPAAQVMDPASVDAAVDRMWPRLSPAQFVRELLGSKQRIRSAAAEYLSADQIELLYRGAADRVSDEPWTLADLALIDEAEGYMSEVESLWGHIVVDEAQDLTPMQLFALRRRSRRGSMTLVGDVAQSTGPFARDSWDDVVEALKSRLPAEVEELQHGYRVPKEVFEVAAKLLPLAAPGITAPTIVRRANADPMLFDVVSGQMAREVARVASHHSSKGRFVGVIAPKETWEQIQNAFTEAELKWSDSSEGQLGSSINLVTPEDSKGLEFDAVVVVEPQAIMDQDNGARLLYIALTRTTSRLDVIAPAGEIPQILRGAFSEITYIDDPEVSKPSEEPQNSAGPTIDEGSPVDAPSIQPEVEAASSQPGMDHAADSAEQVSADKATVTPLALARSNGSAVPSFGPPPVQAGTSANVEQFNPVEVELIARNAEYLLDVVLKFYGPEIRRAVMEETLRRLDVSSGAQ
ncbi:AAA family ATPase [Arthrobacter sp. JSM 101049]|uniref:AAA family ATPase n=1 Tax=Arthrobacter sp. JSM 101049 TaxID=929097 RepID=UPI0035670011